VIGLFKTEVIHRRGPWRSFDAVEYATLEWLDWFNNRRLLEPKARRSQRLGDPNDDPRRPNCLAGHVGFELANPSASYLIGIA
jgi:hypothetical protein